MKSEEFERALKDYRKAFPDSLKEQLGSILSDVVERDIPDNVYTTILCKVSDMLTAECVSLKFTPPLWTESGGRACILSYMDNLRRDVRHTLKHQLVTLGVITPPSNTIRDGVQFFYIPFKFSTTTERHVDLVLTDLHHLLVKLYPVIDPYIPLRRTIQKRVETSFQNSPVFKDWTMDRVDVGHTDHDPAYTSSPVSFHDVLIRQDPDGSRHPTMTTPQHRILTRETYTNKSVDRCYANLTLNINVFTTHKRTGEKVQMTYDYSPFVLSIEFPRSPRFVILRHPGLKMPIRPGSYSITTLRPAQWTAYETVVVPNIPRAALWLLIHEIVTRCRDDCDLQRYISDLDESIPDAVSWDNIRTLLPSRQLEMIEKLSQTPDMTELRRLPTNVVVTDVIRANAQGRGRLRLQSPFLKDGRWCIQRADDDTLWTHKVLYDFVVASVVLRTFVDALIVSHVLDAHPVYDVPYVSEESMHDTFY